MINWVETDRLLNLASAFILTEEESRQVQAIEQSAYEANLPTIRQVLERVEKELRARDFWTELRVAPEGTRFRYSRRGFYGPGGFSSQFHVAGPLVVATINPKGDQYAAFYANNIEDNTF